MIFYLIASILLGSAIIAYRFEQPFIQPIVIALYGLTSLIIGFFDYSSITVIYMLRYFFYISGALVAAVLPIFLIVFSLLLIQRQVFNKQATQFQRWISLLMTGSMLGLVLYTFWVFISRDNWEIARIISVYIYMALYMIALFASYILLNLMIKIWPINKTYSAIIVLGAKIEEDDQLSFTLQARLNQAIKLYVKQSQKTQPPKMIVTGGNGNGEGTSEAVQMGRYLEANGISATDIILESQAHNTEENFYYAGLIAEERQVDQHMLVVTNTFHLVRAYYFAWLNGLKLDFIGARSSLFSWPYSVMREYLAFLLLTKEINYICMVLLTVYGFLQAFNIY